MKSDLKEEIFKRKKSGYEFTGAQLWNLSRALIAANGFLQENQMKHGDIRPENLVKVNETCYKVFENIRDPPGKGQKLSLQRKNDIYTSPLIFENYSQGIYKVDHNKSKSDVFSLGLTLLESGLLQSVQGVFDRRKSKMDVEELHELIQQFEYRYVEEFELCQALRSMLMISESDRPDFLELRSKYALNLGLKELADSNIWADDNQLKKGHEYEVSMSRTHHNPAFSALGMNKANNPISRSQEKYGTNYMDFDEEEVTTVDYWSSPDKSPGNKEYRPTLKSNPLNGTFFTKKRQANEISPQKTGSNGIGGGLTLKNTSKTKKALQLNNLRFH